MCVVLIMFLFFDLVVTELNWSEVNVTFLFRFLREIMLKNTLVPTAWLLAVAIVMSAAGKEAKGKKLFERYNRHGDKNLKEEKHRPIRAACLSTEFQCNSGFCISGKVDFTYFDHPNSTAAWATVSFFKKCCRIGVTIQNDGKRNEKMIFMVHSTVHLQYCIISNW